MLETQSLLPPRIPKATGTWAWIFPSLVYSSNPLGSSPVLRFKLGKLGPAGEELLAAAWHLETVLEAKQYLVRPLRKQGLEGTVTVSLKAAVPDSACMLYLFPDGDRRPWFLFVCFVYFTSISEC